MDDYSIIIGGAAGQGVQWATAVLSRLLLRLGYFVCTNQDYQSRIRGGHNFARVRFADRPLGAVVGRTDFLLALNGESLEMHMKSLAPEGAALCVEGDDGGLGDPRLRILPKGVGPAAAAGPRYSGVKLLAMLACLLGCPGDMLAEEVRAMLGPQKKQQIVETNLEAIEAVFDYGPEPTGPPIAPKIGANADHLLVGGHEAMAMGMIAAGIGVYAGYPMSPATSILNLLARHGPALGIAVEMVEDEIAALNIAIGAAYAGVRAAAGSSGGGISLMTEAIGLAGITETPVVIVDGQRSGPATGMATRTEQADLLFVVHAAQGEFPRAVLAPTGPEDAFYLAAEAFNLAERWQTPVFLMSDHALADTQCTVPAWDLTKVTIDRGAIAPEPEEVGRLVRYRLTETGVSPRAFPVVSKWLVVQDSHEHDEKGSLCDDAENRVRQVSKRMRKLAGIAAGLPGPELAFGDAGTLLLCWGSTVGPVLEALPVLREQGHDLGAAVFRYLYPMSRERVRAALAGKKRLLTIEANFTGQLGRLLLAETGIATHGHIGKYDGRLFTVEDVVALVQKEMESEG